MSYFYILSTIGIFILISQTSYSHCANILFFHGVSTYSHRIVVWNLVEGLANLGHNVTFFQPFHPKRIHPNVTEFYPPELELALKQPDSYIEPSVLSNRLATHRNVNQFFASVSILPKLSLNLCSKLLSTSVGQQWIANSNFDLLIIDAAFNECGLGLAYKHSAKIIYFATSTFFSWHYEPFGIFPESSFLPDMHVSYPYPMSFYEKVTSTILPLIFYYYKVWFYYPALEQILKTGLNAPNMPNVAELEKSVSLMFINSHFSEEFSRSLPPFVVPVGGIGVSEEKREFQKIPKDMAQFMNDSGENGFILVSFGSAAQISHAPDSLRDIFYTAFANSNTRFIWKWEGDRPTGMPENVFTSEWLPQNEILAHSNIKAFMTHGGLMSIQEAITSAVPMICLPIFAEQDYNSFRIERLGRGLMIEISSLTLEQLQGAINEILTNSTYKTNMIKTQKLFADRPETPIQTAIWWTEYVLRTSDLSHLKPLSSNQTWYERRLLDVWFFIGGIIIIILMFILYILNNIIFNFLFVNCNNFISDQNSYSTTTLIRRNNNATTKSNSQLSKMNNNNNYHKSDTRKFKKS